MAKMRRIIQFVFSTIILLSLGLSAAQPQIVSAQSGDGIKRQVNAESGKVSFIGPENGRSVSASKALGISSFARPADPALALAKRFAPEFGLENPDRDLSVKESDQPQEGRLTVRYQQNYQGIPVMGGELIVNTNVNGDLYSMNGEVSSELSLSIEPAIDSERAKQIALKSAAKWHQKTSDDFLVSEPDLWIYDESLLRASNRVPELVWRMEVTSVDDSLPVRELVLVNAQRGNISLHFNQTDTAWHLSGGTNTAQSAEASVIPSSSNNSATYYVREANKIMNNAPLTLAGATWYVATTGNNSNSCAATGFPCSTINGAIGKAADGDTIKVAGGTYTGTGAEVVLINKGVTLSGGWNASFTAQTGTSIIDGQLARRSITVVSTSAIDHLTIQNGFHSIQGGGIFNSGTLTIDNTTISSNKAGTWDLGGDGVGGGGIYNFGTLTINNTTIKGNTAGNPNFGSGGAYGGGGILNYGGSITLNNSLISGNIILGEVPGSGIHSDSGSLTINNSTVSGNINGLYGAVYLASSTTILNNSTISRNQSNLTYNVYGFFSSFSVVTLRNTIIARNGIHGDCSQDFGTITSQGYNLIGNKPAECTFTPTTGDIVGTSADPINPQLTPLQDNGGPTLTHALMVGSPAINAGNPSAPGSGGSACLATDQRGTARPVGGRCDIGAYEGSVPWAPSALVNTYTASGSSSLPGNFLCNEADPNCTAGDTNAKAAHKYAIGTHSFYATQHDRDSIDNNGMTIISSVNYCSPSSCPYYNAFWSGTQMVFGSGYALADDVVAHEFTHGVTQYESNLFYYYQSGAINESFSDLWGEYYDQTNGLGNDTAGVKWLHGEDISGQGANRSMNNPPAFGDPDKMSSPNYYEGEDDSGGVHTNSGINNKAVFLMVDGGTFNNKTVTALGWVKTAAIYYEVNTNLLSSGSDYSDLYYALQQACSNLTGQNGITAADCQEVKDAIDAVEMNGQPAPNFNTDAPLCDAGISPTYTFIDDLEAGTANWTFTNGAYPRWQIDSPNYGLYAQSGVHSLYADDSPDIVTDASARLASFTVPVNGYLHFAHAYEFEAYLPSPGPYYFDGGVLEYSINGGSTWLNAGSLIDFNGYRGTIFTGAGNPLSGRSAFVGSSHGYISTRLNLASLVGKSVMFRWRMGLDEAVDFGGWWVDNIKVYSCIHTNHNVDVTMGGTLTGVHYVPSGQSTSPRYKLNNGPVHVESTNGQPIFTSQRAIFGSSFNSIVGYPGNQLTTDYWFTSYDDTGMITFLVIGNPHPSQTAEVDVFIGGTLKGHYSIAPGQRVFPRYGINAGPVHVVSTNGVNIFSSERTKFGNSFNEVMGYPGDQLTTEYWFTSYDDAGMITYLVVGNPHETQTAEVDVYIDGNKMNATPYQIAPGQRIFPRYGINNGPVRVVSTNGVNIFSSERTKFGNTFNEVMGYPGDQVHTEFWFTSYDDKGMITYLVVGNPSSSQTAEVDVYIGGVKKNATPYAIAPGQRMFQRYSVNAGPVHVVSTNGVAVFASERSKYQSSFNEILGLAGNQLATDYWFTSYDDVGMSTFLAIGAP